MTLVIEPVLQLQFETFVPNVKTGFQVLQCDHHVDVRPGLMRHHLDLVVSSEGRRRGLPVRQSGRRVGHPPFAEPEQRGDQVLAELQHQMRLCRINFADGDCLDRQPQLGFLLRDRPAAANRRGDRRFGPRSAWRVRTARS